MPKRSRQVSDADSDALLSAIRECRAAAVRALAQAPINSEGALAISSLLDVLDGLAEALVGDRRRFWAKQHFTPQGGGSLRR